MPRCDVCGDDDCDVATMLCDKDNSKLQRLLNLTEPLGDNSVELKNVRLTTDIQSTPYVVAIDGQGVSGWQRPFGIDGAVKCMVCDGLSYDHPVCQECKSAILAFRLDSKGTPIAEKILEFFTNSKLHAFFEMAGEAAFEKWMANELAGMGDGQTDDDDPRSAGSSTSG